MTPLLRRRAVGSGDARVDAWLRDVDAAVGKAFAPSLRRDIASYLRSGTPGSAPAAVSADPAAAEAFGIFRHEDQLTDPLEPVVLGLADLPGEVVLRWAVLSDAAYSGRRYWHELRPIGGSTWPESLVHQIASVLRVLNGRGEAPHPAPLGIDVVERALVAAGQDAGALLEVAFQDGDGPYSRDRGVRAAIASLAGYPDAVARRRDALTAQVLRQGASVNVNAAYLLGMLPDEVLVGFAGPVAHMATSSNGTLRAVAAPVAARCGEAVRAPLRELATSAPPAQRSNALRALWVSGDPGAREWARSTAAADRAASVRALADEWTHSPTPSDRQDPGPTQPDTAPAAPERPPVRWQVPVTPEVRAALEQVRTRVNNRIAEHDEQRRAMQGALAKQTGKPGSAIRPTPTLPASWVRDMAAELGRETPPRPKRQALRLVRPEDLAAQVGDLGVTGALRVLNSVDGIVAHDGSLTYVAVELVRTTHARTGRPDLLELSDLLDSAGMDGAGIVSREMVNAWSTQLGADWPDADVVPFVARNAVTFATFLSEPYRDYGVSTGAVLRALGRLPVPSDDVAHLLFQIALTGPKVNREVAQAACAQMRDRDARLLTALSDGKADVRTEAARWLMRLQLEQAVPALAAAVVKERHDVAKGAMLDALEALGRPVEDYLDRDALAAQAATGLAKGLPKALDWLQWSSVPEVRWADSGGPVPLPTVQWLVAQAVRAKSPEPNVMLRKYCGMFEGTSREAFGQYLLEAWLAEDVRSVDPQTAAANATQRAQELRSYMRSWPQAYADDPKREWSAQELTAWLMPICLKEPAGSAIASKGLLAVVAACADARVAAPVGAYLKEWYGMRAAQGKALIAMLAWVEHPTATQLVLSIGSRFRTKGFQDEATRHAQALAERKGWTVAELADRTIPTAGLDDHGVLELSYGPRTFRASLGPDLTLVLHGPDGEPVRALPSPRQSDDADAAAAAKKAFSSAKKQLKALTQQQSERLYEAMCIERSWPFDDWHRYLAQHPVMRHLVQRLVWAATLPDGTVVAFRPLDDGTFTDADDAEVTLPAEATVRVAHGTGLGEAEAAWQRHLDDYEVVPLFRQLGARVPEPTAQDATQIEDVRGHLVEAFRLRGRATKLGYTRGAPVDGGWFVTYEKRFPGIGLAAVMEFTGNSLPEENRTVALDAMAFERIGGQGSDRPPVRLADVPRVLLAEACADLHAFAADGTGYDPEWRTKVDQ